MQEERLGAMVEQQLKHRPNLFLIRRGERRERHVYVLHAKLLGLLPFADCCLAAFPQINNYLYPCGPEFLQAERRWFPSAIQSFVHLAKVPDMGWRRRSGGRQGARKQQGSRKSGVNAAAEQAVERPADSARWQVVVC